MKRDGFTLIELIMAISIASVLGAIAIDYWNTMRKKNEIEGQIRTIHADLLSLRSEALYNKRARTAVIGTTTFSIYSSNVVTTTAQSKKDFRYPMIWNSGGDSITFDTSGLASGTEKTICIVPESTTEINKVAVDSLVISAARINLAKRKGGDCVSSNNDLKQK